MAMSKNPCYEKRAVRQLLNVTQQGFCVMGINDTVDYSRQRNKKANKIYSGA